MWRIYQIIMKDFLVNAYNILVDILIIYVSGWLMFIKPIVDIVGCSNITGSMIAILILKIIFALPVARIIYAIAIRIALKIF